ncbi:hypothetical protein [Pseudomonas sp. R1-1]
MGLGWPAQRIKIAERFDSTVSEIDTVAEDTFPLEETPQTQPLHK